MICDILDRVRWQQLPEFELTLTADEGVGANVWK